MLENLPLAIGKVIVLKKLNGKVMAFGTLIANSSGSQYPFDESDSGTTFHFKEGAVQVPIMKYLIEIQGDKTYVVKPSHVPIHQDTFPVQLSSLYERDQVVEKVLKAYKDRHPKYDDLKYQQNVGGIIQVGPGEITVTTILREISQDEVPDR